MQEVLLAILYTMYKKAAKFHKCQTMYLVTRDK